MTNGSDEEKLVPRTMTRKQFFSLFPWKTIVKLYFLFFIYITVSCIIFFSIEQCLNDQRTPKHDTMPQNKGTNNCTLVAVHIGGGIHAHEMKSENDSKKDDDIINVKKCNTLATSKGAAVESKECKLKAMNILRWLYFTIVHFHGADTFFLHAKSAWGQTLTGPMVVFGIAMATRLYTLIGFVGVNTLNFVLRKIRARLRLHRKATLKYELVLIGCCLQGVYIITCSIISMPYAKDGVTVQNVVFKWLMLLSTISDENLIPDCFAGSAQEVIAPIVLVFIGYIFTSTFIGTIVNCKYRLTYKVNAKIPPKKTGLQGWWV